MIRFNKILALICLLALSTALIAQNSRNVVKVGLYYDNAVVGYTNYNTDVASTNKFGFIAGYERYIGNRIGLNFGFHKYIGASDFFYSKDNTNYRAEATFNENGYGISYESRFYFDDIDSEGGNSGFVGVVFQHNRFTQTVTNVRHTNNLTSITTNFADFENKVNYNRLGIRLGGQFSVDFSSELYLSLFVNLQPTRAVQPISSPTYIPNISYGITYLLGLPF